MNYWIAKSDLDQIYNEFYALYKGKSFDVTKGYMPYKIMTDFLKSKNLSYLINHVALKHVDIGNGKIAVSDIQLCEI